MALNLVALPAFTDNYIWLLHDGREALVVDPGDAAPVVHAMREGNLALRTILVTHHHADHTAGVQSLIDEFAPRVFGPASDPLPHPCEPVDEGTRCLALEREFLTLSVPGHTAGHVAYFLEASADEAPVLFCGDTLFSAGCGRLFEGTATQMHASLSRLASLPGATRVCCAHEYTMANLRFSKAVESDNDAVDLHLAHCAEVRAEGMATLPSTIDKELQINPFLRCHKPGVQATALVHGAKSTDAVDVFAAIREWKNVFR